MAVLKTDAKVRRRKHGRDKAITEEKMENKK